MDIIDESRVVIQSLSPTWAGREDIEVAMLRLDLIHPVVQGNKWYKLRYNIDKALEEGYTRLLTFGGVYSNHLSATAGAAQAYGLPCIGIVRGDEGTITPTMRQCHDMGMELYFISRQDYKRKNDPDFLAGLAEQFDQPYIIPEGGANEAGRLGAERIEWEIPEGYTHVCVSVGTGTTLVGLRNALPLGVRLCGYAPMKQGAYLEHELRPHLRQGKDASWTITDNWHFGGFGKSTDELLSFMNEFYTIHHIPLDIIYTAKMMYGIQQQLREGYFPAGSRILCIHTGGLQGNASASEKLNF